jgi:2-amino-4-hydroxy-6-hydroxymethyldihydropteridine diphosphokinase
MGKTVITYLLTGSNIGEKLAFLKRAEAEIAAKVGNIIDKSSYYESEAWGNTALENFWNQCLAVETSLSAAAVLKTVLDIEKTMGRVRSGEWQAREIDIDILFYGEEIINTKDLIVPHPRLHERNFVLVPMMEINGDFLHPVLQIPVDELFFECKDPLEVYLLEP